MPGHKRQRIELINGIPTLAGRAITAREILEIRNAGQWQRVRLDTSHDRYKRYVLRFEDDDNISVFAIGALARRVVVGSG